MRTIKKVLLIFLTAVMMMAIGIAVTACGDNEEPTTVTLTFVTNGGTAVDPIEAQAGEKVTLPATTKGGFEFKGWYLNEALTGTSYSGTITAPKEDTTYYAKWQSNGVTGTTYTVTLDPDGGTLTSGLEYLIAEGANVYDVVGSLSPRKSGLSFGAWFYGEEEVTRDFVMPGMAITLTARYKVDYTVEAYLQNVAGTGFQRSDANVTYGSDYVGKTVTPAIPAIEHYRYTATPSGATPVTTLELSEDAEANVFKLYYARETHTITYNANMANATGSVADQTGVYGASLPTAILYSGTAMRRLRLERRLASIVSPQPPPISASVLTPRRITHLHSVSVKNLSSSTAKKLYGPRI